MGSIRKISIFFIRRVINSYWIEQGVHAMGSERMMESRRKIKQLGFVALSGASIITGLGAQRIQAASSSSSPTVDLVGLGTYSMVSLNTDAAAKKQLEFQGGGLRLSYNVATRGIFEIGAFYVTRSYGLMGQNMVMREWQVQGGFGYYFTPSLFADFGGYFSKIANSSQAYTTTGYGGVYVGLGFLVPFHKSVALLIHPQYHYAVSPLVFQGTIENMRPNELQIMLGLRFGNY